MSEVHRTRLHVSGLTPKLSREDLLKRLSSFGHISDEYYDPSDRGKWVFMTFEGSGQNLRRCLNSLSGSTYKGAKLRIGEARMNWRERLEKERAENFRLSPPKKKRNIRHSAVHAQDMSLVTPDHLRPGWKATSSGKLIRPMRMRPLRPLPRTLDELKAGSDGGKRKKRFSVPIRARRRTIDVTRWGGERLSGVFLQSRVVPTYEVKTPAPPTQASSKSIALAQDEDVDDSEEDEEEAMEVETALTEYKAVKGAGQQPPEGNALDSFAAEASRNLALLQNMFEAEEDWDGRENLPSDIDTKSLPQDSDLDDEASEDQSVADVEDIAEPRIVVSAPAAPIKSKLKDLFAPQEELGGFSLLSQLDLDLDIDEDIVMDSTFAAPADLATVATASVAPPQVLPTSKFDPKQPMFFAMPKQPAQKFHRTATDDEIRKRWENTKVELTAGWKKRWREASKSNRRGRVMGSEE